MTFAVSAGGFGPNYGTKQEFATNAHFQLAMDLIVYVFHTTLMIILAPRMKCHVEAVEKSEDERRGPPCPVQRNFMMSDKQYNDACAAVAKVAEEKAKEEAAKRAAYEAELEAELGEEIEFRDDGWI